MSRVMTIWLPRWPVQRRLVERPELRKVPVFVCRRERRGVMTIVSWAWAEPPRRAGGGRPDIPRTIAPGTSLAEGMAVLALAHGSRACHVAEVAADDPVADALELERLARWCRRFSPTVGIEEPAGGTAPECILLDVSGTAGFFGGEAALARTAAWTLAARGLHARVGIADTGGASWAAARHPDLVSSSGPARGSAGRARRRRWAVVPPGAAAAALAGLPAAALRLDAATLAALGEVGVDTVGGVLRLSAKSLAARFPSGLALRRAEFLGQRAEPPLAPRGAELPRAVQDFDVPLATTDAAADTIRAVLERLVGSCVAPLAARGEGVLMLQVRLEPAVTIFDGGGARGPWTESVSAAPAVIDVGVFRPSGSARHLVELAMLRLGRCRPPREIGAIAVEVVAAAAAACRQRSLFDGAAAGADDDVQTAALLDRLAGRLGRAAVFEPRPVADPQPEHAWLAAPPGAAPVRASAAVAAGRRPVWLVPQPVRVAMVAVAPAGPPGRFQLGGRQHVVARALGPERIETAWWRGPTVRRDYYVIETESGERFWVFRRLRDGGWFLHGVFA